ncbi:50S ribosomal protein L22 [Verrucomicrobiales bacterium BCK34]|nr:50S ribosomal protein L22 [Verrucomicrobiales bacterium BCK34]
MDVTSTYKFARISARKARDVAREIQGLPVSAALDLLNFTPRKGAELFNKTMKAALADAENNFELSVEGLFVKSAVVGEGPTFKRFKPRARGSASAILKRTSHITVVLSDDALATPSEKKKHVSEKGAKAAPKKAAAEKTAPKKEAKKEVSAKSDTSGGGRVDEKLGMVYDSAPAEVDDLKEINGVGPKLEEKLNSIGIYVFKQIADWTDANVAEFDELLSFKGRIERDEWISKAKQLHEEKHGK